MVWPFYSWKGKKSCKWKKLPGLKSLFSLFLCFNHLTAIRRNECIYVTCWKNRYELCINLIFSRLLLNIAFYQSINPWLLPVNDRKFPMKKLAGWIICHGSTEAQNFRDLVFLWLKDHEKEESRPMASAEPWHCRQYIASRPARIVSPVFPYNGRLQGVLRDWKTARQRFYLQR